MHLVLLKWTDSSNIKKQDPKISETRNYVGKKYDKMKKTREELRYVHPIWEK